LTQDADFPQLIGAAQKRGLSVMPMAMDHGTLQKDTAKMAPLIESGRMRMPEMKVYPLARAAEALQAIKTGGGRGKIAVEI
jgi:NADPH:quinone reductase-like Zn-dependent oxidoreductase